MTWTLRLGDCLAPDGLASLADQSVDHVIVDPPYSEHVHAAHRIGSTARDAARPSRRVVSRKQDLGFEHLTSDTMDKLSVEFARLARRWVLVFCDVESAHLWRGALVAACSDAAGTTSLEYVRTCFWRRIGGTPQFTGDRPANMLEAIVLAHRRGKKRWNGGGKGNVYDYAIVLDRGHTGARLHPTQKPIRLLRALVADFTDPGDLICDPMAGSATTLVAAKQLGRSAIGWEREPAWHAAGLQRLAQEELPIAPAASKHEQAALDLLERFA